MPNILENFLYPAAGFPQVFDIVRNYSDDDQTRPPASPKAGKPDPEDPISPTEPRALHRALEHGYLLAERQVLCDECGAALEQQPEEKREDLQRALEAPV